MSNVGLCVNHKTYLEAQDGDEVLDGEEEGAHQSNYWELHQKFNEVSQVCVYELIIFRFKQSFHFIEYNYTVSEVQHYRDFPKEQFLEIYLHMLSQSPRLICVYITEGLVLPFIQSRSHNRPNYQQARQSVTKTQKLILSVVQGMDLVLQVLHRPIHVEHLKELPSSPFLLPHAVHQDAAPQNAAQPSQQPQNGERAATFVVRAGEEYPKRLE